MTNSRRPWPTRPAHPERVCWGCDRLCPADRMTCAGEKARTCHPSELFGAEWEADAAAEPDEAQLAQQDPPGGRSAPAAETPRARASSFPLYARPASP